MRRQVLLLAVAALSTGAIYVTAGAQPPAARAVAGAIPIDAAGRKLVVETLARELEDKFVFPEVGARYAAMLRANLAAGAYDGLATEEALGVKVTADLQAVSPDGHLRLAPRSAFNRPRGPTTASGAPVAPPPALEPPKMIGDVAYLRFNLFPGDPAVTKAARDFLLTHADAKAVIIDARAHRGGGLEEMDAILPLLFAKPATLVRMDTRAGVPTPLEAGPTLVNQPSPATVVRRDHRVTPETAERRLQAVPVFYLTSKRTASAAEHLALAFKRTGRATLIGEATRGAGHYGGQLPMGRGMAAFVPVGRTYDPDTGKGWEGEGVAPDVAVPADQALDEALKRALAAGARI